MSLASNIVGLTGTQADVDPSNRLSVGSKDLGVTAAPFTTIGGEIANAAEPSGAIRKRVAISSDGRVGVGLDRPVLAINFGGSATSANAIPQDALKQLAATMTVAAGSSNGGYLILNSGNSTTASQAIGYVTYATFPTYGGMGTVYEWEAQTLNQIGTTNAVIELGSAYISSVSTAGLLDGFCFRWTATGGFQSVISINGTETTLTLNGNTPPTDGVNHRFTIRVNNDGLYFFVDMLCVGFMPVPNTGVGPGLQPNLPAMMRILNTGAVGGSAVQLKIAEMWITQGSADWNKPWPHIIAGMGQHASNVPFGTLIGETTNGGNATALPAAAAGLNTAAMTGCATLGGTAIMNAQATNVAAAGDMIAFSYQVPVITATQASKRLHITGVSVSCSNGGAVVATTPTTLEFGLAWGNTGVSLATADAANTKAARHLKLGQMWAPVGAVIGQCYDKDLVRSFITPIVVNPSEYFNITVRFLLGTATASQTVVIVSGVEGYWE